MLGKRSGAICFVSEVNSKGYDPWAREPSSGGSRSGRSDFGGKVENRLTGRRVSMDELYGSLKSSRSMSFEHTVRSARTIAGQRHTDPIDPKRSHKAVTVAGSSSANGPGASGMYSSPLRSLAEPLKPSRADLETSTTLRTTWKSEYYPGTTGFTNRSSLYPSEVANIVDGPGSLRSAAVGYYTRILTVYGTSTVAGNRLLCSATTVPPHHVNFSTK